jgi:small-conductance mechanosensitive channel
MIDRPFRIGDRIQLMSGKSGDVVDIGLRSTRIRTPENTLLIIPNAELCNSTVHNMAFPDLRSQGKIAIGVAYGSDVEMVKRLLVETAQGEPDLLEQPAPEAYFIAFGDNALMMTLIFWVTDYTKLYAVTDRLNSRILSCFETNGIQIPYPTRRVLLEREG